MIDSSDLMCKNSTGAVQRFY